VPINSPHLPWTQQSEQGGLAGHDCMNLLQMYNNVSLSTHINSTKFQVASMLASVQLNFSTIDIYSPRASQINLNILPRFNLNFAFR